MKRAFLLTFVVLGLLGVCICSATVPDLWPMPQSFKFGANTLVISKPCNLLYKIKTGTELTSRYFYQESTKFYESSQISEFCEKELGRSSQAVFDWSGSLNSTHPKDSTVIISIDKPNNITMVPGSTDESYTLTVTKKAIKIAARTYVGVVRALTTLSQLIKVEGSQVKIENVPLTIKDRPRYPYRGVMVDTSRHFIDVPTLMKLMDAMALNKLNAFHWHISDSDSFPMHMPSHPNMTKGAFSNAEVYTSTDVQKLVKHAKARGIAIIPELDAPSHTRSWAEAPEWSNYLTCVAPGDPYFGIPLGMLDVTQDTTYELLQGLYNDLQRGYFKDFKFLHIGADEVDPTCTSQIPRIAEFMKSHGFEDYGDVLNYFVNRTKGLLASTTTRVIWSNPDTLYLKLAEDDIVQWWGNTTGLSYGFETYPNNRFILSNFDHFYLDCGMGSYFGNASWCAYNTWGKIYSFEPDHHIHKEEWRKNVFGGEVAMWDELGNDYNVGTKIWPRGIAFAERFWSPKNNSGSNYLSMFTRMNTQINRFKKRGISVSPASSGYCEKNPQNCFKATSVSQI